MNEQQGKTNDADAKFAGNPTTQVTGGDPFGADARGPAMLSSRGMRLLAVEDDEDHRELILSGLNAPGRESIDLSFACSVADACARLAVDRFDCVIIDQNLPDGCGLDILDRAKEHLLATPVVGLSTSGRQAVTRGDVRAEGIEFIQKHSAFADGSLRRRLFAALARYHRRAAGMVHGDETLAASGILDRTAFKEHHARLHHRALREHVVYALMLADVDQIAQDCDQSCGVAGDEVIEKVARAIRSDLREHDVIGRYGERELAVLCEHNRQVDHTPVATRLCKHISKLEIEQKHHFEHGLVTISMGVAMYDPAAPETEEQIVRRAGGALEEARGAGQSRVIRALRST
ncbi:MAG: diguanylate cyclase [Planctomycetes bacterium]|nr:diguanylate cyclase [Planctomycetota bacterium]